MERCNYEGEGAEKEKQKRINKSHSIFLNCKNKIRSFQSGSSSHTFQLDPMVAHDASKYPHLSWHTVTLLLDYINR